MQLRWKPLRDLNSVGPVGTGGWNSWDSTGDDPGFQCSLPFLRRRYIVIGIESQEISIDPRLYVNYGAGFSERNALAPQAGKAHVILIDVGTIGNIRQLRLDPATFPVRFSMIVKSLSKLGDAETLSEQLRNRIGEKVPVTRFTNLTRFRFGSKGALRKSASVSAKEHARSSYDLAKRLPRTQPVAGETWLSIVVPVYNTPKRYLNDLVKSFRAQDTEGVELILSDDGSSSAETLRWFAKLRRDDRVKIVRAAANGGIAAATNAGLSAASGRWVTFLDHDDVLAPFALRMIHKSLHENPQARFLYTDELVVTGRLKPVGHMLKPAYDPVLLSGVNYINHMSIYQRERLMELGGLRLQFDGSQDYDCLLRYLSGVDESEVLHLPYPAYWWRRTGQTYSTQFLDKATANARKALAERYQTAATPVSVVGALTDTLHRVEFAATEAEFPLISVIIPSKDSLPLISRLLGDLFERTDYPHFEVIIVDNGSTEQPVLDLYRRMSDAHPNFVSDVRPAAFNFAAAINRGVELANGEHYLLLNNDVEVTKPDWLRELVNCLNFEKTGIVGAKLLYPNDTIQHAGVIVGFGGLAGHWYVGKQRNFPGPMGRLHVRESMTSVTAAVMLISGECWKTVGKFDEQNFAVAYNDVDYCMRAFNLGIRSIWTPFACLYHHESVSRGAETLPQNVARFEREKNNLRRIHQTQVFSDPAISPYFRREYSDPGLKLLDTLPQARRWFPERS